MIFPQNLFKHSEYRENWGYINNLWKCRRDGQSRTKLTKSEGTEANKWN